MSVLNEGDVSCLIIDQKAGFGINKERRCVLRSGGDDALSEFFNLRIEFLRHLVELNHQTARVMIGDGDNIAVIGVT